MNRKKPVVDMVNPALPGFEALVEAQREAAVRLQAEQMQAHKEKKRVYSHRYRDRKRAAKKLG